MTVDELIAQLQQHRGECDVVLCIQGADGEPIYGKPLFTMRPAGDSVMVAADLDTEN